MSAQHLAAGMMLGGRFELRAPIGATAMHSVWRAVDHETGEACAVKIFRGGEFDSLLERFEREALFLGRLDHPNIPSLLHYDIRDRPAYIAMQLVEGQGLDHEATQVSLEEASWICAGALDALEHLHSRDIAHRDLKLGNLVVGPNKVGLVDFGVACCLTPLSAELTFMPLHSSRRGANITGDGRVVGTVDYCSPEQVLGHQVDTRTDLYSLGVVLFRLATGQMPFAGADLNLMQVAMQHVRKQIPDPQGINPRISPGLKDVIVAALEKDPANRFQSASEMRQALSLATTYLAAA